MFGNLFKSWKSYKCSFCGRAASGPRISQSESFVSDYPEGPIYSHDTNFDEKLPNNLEYCEECDSWYCESCGWHGVHSTLPKLHG